MDRTEKQKKEADTFNKRFDKYIKELKLKTKKEIRLDEICCKAVKGNKLTKQEMKEFDKLYQEVIVEDIA